MKKLFFTLVIITSVASFAKAQTERKRWMLGGRATYSYYKADLADSKASNSFSVVPNAGYFFGDRIAVGMGLGYQYSNYGFKSMTGQEQGLLVSPFGRMYFPLAENFAFFGEAAVQMSFETIKETDDNGKAIKTSGTEMEIGVNLSPGLSFFPSKRVALEFAFSGLRYSKSESRDSSGNNIPGSGSQNWTFNTNFFSPKIGIQFFY